MQQGCMAPGNEASMYNSEIEGSGVSVGGLTMSMTSSTFVRVLEANLEYYRQAQ